MPAPPFQGGSRISPAPGNPAQGPNEAERVRINHQIRLSPVRLVDPDGAQLGIVTIEEARAKAEELGMDLVEVNPNIRPIVVRIMDYGRFKYDKQKSERKSKTAATELKQIKYRPSIDDHDFETKTEKVRKFLEQGNKVRVTVMFRRRDMRRPENGIRVLHRVAETLHEVGKVDDMPHEVIGRDLTMTVFPLRQPVKKAVAAVPAEAHPHRLRRHERAAAESEAAAVHAHPEPDEPDDDPDDEVDMSDDSDEVLDEPESQPPA